MSPPPTTTTSTPATPATTSNDLSSSTDVLKKMLGLQLNINDGPPNLEQPSTSAATAAAKISEFDQLQKISVEDIFHMVFKNFRETLFFCFALLYFPACCLGPFSFDNSLLCF